MAGRWQKHGDTYIYLMNGHRAGAVFRNAGKWYSWIDGENKTVDWGHLRGKVDQPKRHVERIVGHTDKPMIFFARNPSVYLFTPITKKAKAWVKRNVPLEPWQWLGSGFAVEHRYAEDLFEAMKDAGLVAGKDFSVSA